MNRSRLAVLLAVAALVGAYFALDGQRYLNFETLKAQVSAAQSLYERYPLQTAGGYFLLYVAVAGLSVPGAVPLTLAGGAVFGLLWGTVIVSFASTLGATLAFLVSRFLLRDWVQGRFGERLRAINRGVEREGAFYLFALRLVPAFPFFVINLLMGLTPIRTWTFYWVSQLGMLAGTLVYVYAGTQLGEFRLSAGLVVAFTLLGIFPLLAKRALDVACGAGRYVLQTLHDLKEIPASAVLRDYQQVNLDAAKRLAQTLGVDKDVVIAQGDAFDRASLAAVSPRPTIAIVSGLYELFPDNARVLASLRGIARAMREGGLLIYTGQPWHPQIEMIARVLPNRDGEPWIMRRRTQAEMDDLIRAAGFEKLEMEIDRWGIFTVSLAKIGDLP